MPSWGPPPGDWEPFIKNLGGEAEITFRERNGHLVDVRSHRWNLKPPVIPENYRLANLTVPRLSLVRNLVRSTQGLFTTQLPKPHVPPNRSLGSRAERAADRVEMALSAAYVSLWGQEDKFGQVTDALAGDGEAVWAMFLRRHHWAALRSKGESARAYIERRQAIKEKHFPFVIEHFDTTTYYPVGQDEDGVSEVLIRSRHMRTPVYTKYGLVVSRNESNAERLRRIIGMPVSSAGAAPGTCVVDRYFNRDQWAIIVDGTKVDGGEHEYRKPPFYDALFSTNSDKDPGRRTETISDALLSLQDILETLVLGEENYALFTQFPIMRYKPMGADVPPPPRGDNVKKVQPGDVLGAGMGYDLEVIPWPNVGSASLDMREFLMDFADASSLADILRGRGGGRESAATTTAKMDTARASSLATAVGNLKREIDRCGGDLLEYTDRILKEEVPIWDNGLDPKEGKRIRVGSWLTLDPKDFGHQYQVEHQLEPIVGIERMQRQMMAADWNARGLFSDRHALEWGAGIENPLDMIEAVAVDRITKSQAFDADTYAEAMKELGREGAGPLAKGPPTANQPGGPGGPGVPQIAGVQQEQIPGATPAAVAGPEGVSVG